MLNLRGAVAAGDRRQSLLSPSKAKPYFNLTMNQPSSPMHPKINIEGVEKRLDTEEKPRSIAGASQRGFD
jgi:hypothetical protein